MAIEDNVKQIKDDNSLQWSALHTAASAGNTVLIEQLLEKNMDINQCDVFGWMPIHLSVLHGHLNVLKMFVKAGASINSLTSLHESLVVLAVKFRHTKILSYLVRKKANLLAVTSYYCQAIDLALFDNALPCLKILLFSNDYQDLIRTDKKFLEKIFYKSLKSKQLGVAEFIRNYYDINLNFSYFNSKNLDLDIIVYINILESFMNKSLDNNQIEQYLNSTKIPIILIALLNIILGKDDSLDVKNYNYLIINKLEQILTKPQIIKLIYNCYLSNAIKLINLVENHNISLEYLAFKNDDVNFLKELEIEKNLVKIQSDIENYIKAGIEHAALNCTMYLIGKFSKSYTGNLEEYIVSIAEKCGQISLVNKLIKNYYLNLNLIKKYEINKNDRDNKLLDENLHDPLFPIITIAIFQGGGVKGIGFYGSLKKLVEENILDINLLKIVGGTSAGAITAFLLAIGYDLAEFGQIMQEMNFYELIDTELKEEFFNIRTLLSQRNGLEKILGKELFKFFMKVKNGQIDEDDARVIISSLIIEKIPLAGPLIKKFTEKLGIHNNEFSKLQQNMNQLLDRFRPFIDRIIKFKGLFKGEVLRKKFTGWLKNKQLDENLTFQQLHDLALSNPKKYKDLYVAAYNASKAETEIFSYETTHDAIIVDAVRCSMSIQLFFEPHKYYRNVNGLREVHQNGHVYFDGGSLDNYLGDFFDKKSYKYFNNSFRSNTQQSHKKMTNFQVIGFRLLDPELYDYYENGVEKPILKTDNTASFLMSVINSMITFTKQESDYRHALDVHARTVCINTLDIDTIEFDITNERKNILIESGVLGANAFIKRYRSRETQAIYHLLKQHFLKNYSNDHNKFFNLPQDINTRFQKILKFSNAVSAKNFYLSLPILGIPIHSIKDSEKNTILHVAVKEENVSLVKKIYHEEMNCKNKQGFFPLDNLSYCKHYNVREKIVDFFAERRALIASCLLSSTIQFQSHAHKKRFLLKQMYNEYVKKNPLVLGNLSNEFYQENTLKSLMEIAANKKKIAIDNTTELFNYVYLLLMSNHGDLIKEIGLSIDQRDSFGYAPIHYFVLLNNRIQVENCLKYFAFPHIATSQGETPLDLCLSIASFSKDDTILQQQLMLIFLINKKVLKCKPENKAAIVKLIEISPLNDEQFSKSFNQFKAYNISITVSDESQQFLNYRNFAELNRFKKYSESTSNKISFFKFKSSKPDLESYSSSGIDRHYYTDDEINDLLQIILADKVDILAAMLGTDWQQEHGLTNILYENLQEYIRQRHNVFAQNHLKFRQTIVPINLNNGHWVMLYMSFSQDNQKGPAIFYFDPLGHTIHPEVERVLQEIYPEILINSIGERVQKDGYNCGPWIIFGAESIVHKGGIPGVGEIDIDKVRAQQQALLLEDYAKNQSLSVSHS